MVMQSRIQRELGPNLPMPRSLFSLRPISHLELVAIKDHIDRTYLKHDRLSDNAKEVAELLGTFRLDEKTVVADIGCGTGYLELAMLDRGSPFAYLFAVDVDSIALEVLTYAVAKHPSRARTRIQTVVSDDRDSWLPENGVDQVLFVSTHFFSATQDSAGSWKVQPPMRRYLESIKRALRPGGQVHVFEFTNEPCDNRPALTEPFTQIGLRFTGAQVRLPAGNRVCQLTFDR